MTKNPTLIVLFLCSFSFNFAQTLGIGIKGGVNYNSIGDFYSKGGSIGSGVPDINYEADNETLVDSIKIENWFGQEVTEDLSSSFSRRFLFAIFCLSSASGISSSSEDVSRSCR